MKWKDGRTNIDNYYPSYKRVKLEKLFENLNLNESNELFSNKW